MRHALYLTAFVCVKVAFSSSGSCGGNLSASECSGWTAFFDGAHGTNWTRCSKFRNDPCGCKEGNGIITCAGGHITSINFEEENVRGTISEGIGKLSKMDWL